MASKKQLLQTEKIHIVDFKIIKGQIQSPFDFETENIETHTFSVDFDMGLQLEERLVKADFVVDIQSKSTSEVEEANGFFHFVFIYHVENLDELATFDKKSKKVNINGGLGNAIASITYSTTRGILMTRFQGTALEDFILPIISPNDLLIK